MISLQTLISGFYVQVFQKHSYTISVCYFLYSGSMHPFTCPCSNQKSALSKSLLSQTLTTRIWRLSFPYFFILLHPWQPDLGRKLEVILNKNDMVTPSKEVHFKYLNSLFKIEINLLNNTFEISHEKYSVDSKIREKF